MTAKQKARKDKGVKRVNKTLASIGDKFNFLTIKDFADSKAADGRPYWLCKCDCGKEKIIAQNNLRTGQVKSCGCHRENTKSNLRHGEVKSLLYMVFIEMKSRCLNSNHKFYHYYGGRGISICEEWQEKMPKGYYNFREWALSNNYHDGLTLDRKNNDMGYSPENCHWVSMKEQNRNRRNTKMVEFHGSLVPLGKLCEDFGLHHKTVDRRLRVGWDLELAMLPRGVKLLK